MNLIDKLRFIINKSFRIKDFGELKYFIVIEVVRFNEGIYICHHKISLEFVAPSSKSQIVKR